MNFDKMLSDLIAVEGGYVNDPRDRGGETNWGVTVAVARANGYTGDMRAMTKAQALEIYRSEYFFRPGFDKVMTVSAAVAAELFDTGVNMGQVVASRFFQRCLNALNNEGKHYADIVVDGQIGQISINAFRSLVQRRGLEDAETVMLKGLNCLQGARYIELAENRQKNEAFLFGWLMNRVELPS